MVQIAKLHEPIVEAFERGDAKLAAKLLREHSLGFAAQLGTRRSRGTGAKPISESKRPATDAR